MTNCSVCGKLVLWSGYRTEGEVFCSPYCFTYSEMPGFCEKCVAATEDVAAPNTTYTFYGGSFFIGKSERCPTCHSIVQRQLYMVLFLPIGFGPRYRMLYTSNMTYVGRKLRMTPQHVRRSPPRSRPGAPGAPGRPTRQGR